MYAPKTEYNCTIIPLRRPNTIVHSSHFVFFFSTLIPLEHLQWLPPLVGDELEQATVEAAVNSLPRKVLLLILGEHVQQHPLRLARHPESTSTHGFIIRTHFCHFTRENGAQNKRANGPTCKTKSDHPNGSFACRWPSVIIQISRNVSLSGDERAFLLNMFSKFTGMYL